jgi:HD-GYP domain-containing protein (c-di-GMP phosphodiesterase class II)
VAVFLGGMLVLSEVFDISFPHTVTTISVSVGSPLALAAGLSLGPAHGAMVVMAATLIESVWRKRQPLKAVVNVANFGLATLLSAMVYEVVRQAGVSPLGSLRNMGAVVLASGVFVLINATALAVIVAPVVGVTPWQMWRTNLAGTYVELLTLPTLGGIVPVLAGEHPGAILLLIVPLIGPLLSFQRHQKAERRDEHTHSHSLRVTELVQAILRQMPHTPAEAVQAILAAARVHDLGKVGIGDAVFAKPSALTAEERREIERHAAIGADIVERLEFYRPCAEIIRHHHEHWDGTGYPDKLRGEAIPLGSRIITVADTFDAMTSDRVYRRALPPTVALAELRSQSGKQFDPQVVAAFEQALLADQPQARPAAPSPPAAAVRGLRRGRRLFRPGIAAGPASSGPPRRATPR